jgi:hypothetical protein
MTDKLSCLTVQRHSTPAVGLLRPRQRAQSGHLLGVVGLLIDVGVKVLRGRWVRVAHPLRHLSGGDASATQQVARAAVDLLLTAT